MATKLVISVSGKGGTGKTTVTALLLKWLIQNSEKISLVVDADPATNLPDVLGIKIQRTVGQSSRELKDNIENGTLSPMLSKKDIIEANVFQTLVEEDSFDLLAMGRSEGEGCYCFVNNMLTRILDTLMMNYEVAFLDMEAGLEHLSRRTDRDVDSMIVVTDPSKMGLETARRIKEIVDEVHIDVKHIYLVGNRFTSDLEDLLMKSANDIGLEYGGLIPVDNNVSTYNLTGKPLLGIPDDSPAYKAIEKLAKKIGLTSK
ncbi:ATP-binding protein [Candidatus Bathyarchaeota archaeon]|jgi:CO dehydrogenase maturation factor|nr:ATP-binding protein [Candidatus Bathyarchaeota archaeon]MDP6048079.1 ArsA-related P-loop ATPase [Candidatus Bathyarchaeota archaeon]MDP7443105.1 ArsA-related P-loop ATPase [Candidatus Bathyarchaeota archaeon]